LLLFEEVNDVGGLNREFEQVEDGTKKIKNKILF
jgi:hypothetical protein